jgi:MarR family transcriptional regulator for hemolysin
MKRPASISPLGYLINDVARQLRRRFDDQAKAHGLTLPQWRTLAQLCHTEEISQVALAASTETNPMTMSGILDRLEARGMVERIPDPHDNRAKLARTTAKARALVDEMRAVGTQVYDEALTGVSLADREVLLSALSQISSNLSGQSATRKEAQE